MQRVHVVDSHTEGEPTRLVVSGGPELGPGPLREQRARFDRQHGEFRRAVVTEPRAAPSVVGALLLPPDDPGHRAGLIFFNNRGTLGMCGHGTIGAAVSLHHLGRLPVGPLVLDTPVGSVRAELHDRQSVSFLNVPARRSRADVAIDVPGQGRVTGDVAWGGNWFFLTDAGDRRLDAAEAPALLAYTTSVRAALARAGVTGDDGAPIDHIELMGPPRDPGHDARNFVLCPGGSYDRSPCGTGTSARLACLHAAGALAVGEVWRQEGILGGVFEGRLVVDAGVLRPEIRGSAHVTGEGDLLLEEHDPYRYGVPE
ncbi:MAG TPA: proline racemase family protein [Thermoplasmata archaeon]|nr:proline racemase family protein [Thermoplasmata archaeon]